MKVSFEGNFGHVNCVDFYVDITLEYVKQDVEKELRHMTGRYVKVTIEEIKETAIKSAFWETANSRCWLKTFLILPLRRFSPGRSRRIPVGSFNS